MFLVWNRYNIRHYIQVNEMQFYGQKIDRKYWEIIWQKFDRNYCEKSYDKLLREITVRNQHKSEVNKQGK